MLFRSPLAQRALGLLRRRDFLLEDLHLGDQIGCIFAAFLRRTNRLGYYVAALLHLLEFRLRGAPPSIQLQHRLCHRFEAPPGEPPVELSRMVADESQIVHEAGPWASYGDRKSTRLNSSH